MKKSTIEAPDLAAIGQRFFRYFRSKGLSGREVGKLLGKSPSLVSQMVSGSRFSADVLGAIFEAFPLLSPDWLIYGKGTTEENQESPANDLNAQLQELRTQLRVLATLEEAKTNKQAKERTMALKAILDKALDMRMGLLSEGMDFYRLMAQI